MTLCDDCTMVLLCVSLRQEQRLSYMLLRCMSCFKELIDNFYIQVILIVCLLVAVKCEGISELLEYCRGY